VRQRRTATGRRRGPATQGAAGVDRIGLPEAEGEPDREKLGVLELKVLHRYSRYR
jgi:hypothetical protein